MNEHKDRQMDATTTYVCVYVRACVCPRVRVRACYTLFLCQRFYFVLKENLIRVILFQIEATAEMLETEQEWVCLMSSPDF